jgi:uncharacterized DUF497 family protein
MTDDEFHWDDEKAASNDAEHGVSFDANTMRGDAIRIISARAAEPYEQREYHEQNAQDDQT